MMAKYIHTESVHNTNSAKIIVPLILNLLKPSSVLDVGCGIGTWLRIFSDNGVKDIMGIDGEYVDRNLLSKYINPSQFESVDLEQSFDLQRRFDLAISLEVAEHLKCSAADIFVDSICRHSDTVIFSAAIPGQNGQNHLNEQWISYWVKKFSKEGYEVFDPFRSTLWQNVEIDLWYRQNMLLFSKKNLDLPKARFIDLVLPDLWTQKVERNNALSYQLTRICSGKVGVGFYLKGLLKSLRYFGRKQK